MKLGIISVFLAITAIVVSGFTVGLAGDTGIIIGGVSLAIGMFGLGRCSRGTK